MEVFSMKRFALSLFFFKRECDDVYMTQSGAIFAEAKV